MGKRKNGELVEYKASEATEGYFTQLSDALAKSSLRQVAQAIGLNYNMALKAVKAPIPGEIYDPTALNVAALYALALKKEGFDGATFDWSQCESKVVVAATQDFKVGDSIAMRGGLTGIIVFRTETHVVFIPDDSTKPQCMSFGTFEHQGAKVIAND